LCWIFQETAQIDYEIPMKFYEVPMVFETIVFPAAFSAQSPLGFATARVETSAGKVRILMQKTVCVEISEVEACSCGHGLQ